MSMTLDVTPLAMPMNPFAWAAEQMARSTYPTAEARDEAAIMVRWLRHVAAATPGITSREPVLLTAMSRIALDASVRGQFAHVCGITGQLAEAAPTNGAATGPNGTGGYTIAG